MIIYSLFGLLVLSCTVLKPSGPITVERSGQIIEGLDIVTHTTTAGITCDGKANVVIRNLRISHHIQDDEDDYSQGISFSNCDNIVIDSVRVQLVHPPNGSVSLPNWHYFNIYGTQTFSPVIRNVILSGGSSGVWIGDSFAPKFLNWGVYNVHGPFPRGQCVQFARCTSGIVYNFICKNQWAYSFPEDAISMWRSANSTVRNGVIAGSNAHTGTGLMFEQSDLLDHSWGLAQDIQAWGIGGCCFSTYGGTNITFDNVGCRDNHCKGVGGREAGSGLMWYAGFENPSNISGCCRSADIRVKRSKWYNSCRTPQIWQSKENPDAWVEQDLTESDFTMNEHPITIELCFIVNGTTITSSTKTGKNTGLVGDGSINYGSNEPYPRG